MTIEWIEVPAPTGDYRIAFGLGALDRAGELLWAAAAPPHPPGWEGRGDRPTLPRIGGLGGHAPRRLAVVSAGPVRELYAPRLEASLRAAGFEVASVEAPDGEASKHVGTLALLWSAFRAAGLDRRSAVVALGGGVIGDTAGFAAATYMRGVPLVQVPTTLLAQVDASIGGKVAVDHDGVKNLVGAFHNPSLVITDPGVLATLPATERRSGLAEVIKHAAIDSPDAFARLERELARQELPEPATLAANLRVKVGVVARDPYEQGERAILNLGHTFGHAIEAASDYRLPHGYAVAIGLAAAARTSERLGLAEPGLADRIERLLRQVGLPTACPELGLDPEAVRRTMGSDKKARDGRLRLVLLRSLGRPVVTDEAPEALVRRAIAEMVGA